MKQTNTNKKKIFVKCLVFDAFSGSIKDVTKGKDIQLIPKSIIESIRIAFAELACSQRQMPNIVRQFYTYYF